MVKKIGILLPHTFDTQLAYEAIKEGNYLVFDNHNYDVSIFFEEFTPPIIKPIFGLFNASEVFSYDGTLISTTLSNTKISIKTMKPERKIFYIWELEWLKNEKNYLDNISVYQNKDIELVTVSDDYAKEINNYCGIIPRVVKRFNLKEIYEK
jgi:hypothetical protein